MAAVDTEAPPDLMSVGRHCHHPGCNQLDFLPFKCGMCSGTFCLEHRTCAAHACPKGDANDVSTVICPICAKAIKLVGDEDPNAAFEKHAAAGGCDPSNYAKVKQKPRCPAPNCREKLASSNTYKCKECGVDVCMKHRFPADHKCPGKQATLASAASKRTGPLARFLSSTNGSTGGAQQRQGGSSSSGSGSSWTSLAARWKKSANAQQEKGRQQRQQQQEVIDLTGENDSGSGGNVGGSTSRWQRRRQQQQQQTAWQPEPSRSGPFAGLYPCPQCTRRFTDPLNLLRHVQAQHPGPC